MCAARAKPDADRLFEFAETQQGLFTSAQAVSAGYARSTHTYHVQTGNWVREYRGIYRLKRYPRGEHEQLVLWTLWSRDRSEKPTGVFSHLTALAIKDLSDANPARIDMTVPPDFRRNSETPKILRLHKAALVPSEIISERGYAITTPIRAITDLARGGEVDRDLIEQALKEGRRRGLITRQEIAMRRSQSANPEWFEQLLANLS